jgi:hypothetical protein
MFEELIMAYTWISAFFEEGVIFGECFEEIG